jgi:hypothetical protein
MTVPAVKVKAVCTGSEATLVRASRGRALGQLNETSLKRHAVRARKLTDKWEGLAREQSRNRGRQTGSSGVDPNTQLKAEIFREALTAFETRLKTFEGAAKSPAASASSNQQKRSAEHRTTRAVVRRDLASAKMQRNEGSAKQKPKKSAPAKKAASEPKVVASAPAGVVAKTTARTVKPPANAKPLRATGTNLATSQIVPGKQLRAATAAKQARTVRGGQAPRKIGHTSARGKRTQARRDARN